MKGREGVIYLDRGERSERDKRWREIGVKFREDKDSEIRI